MSTEKIDQGWLYTRDGKKFAPQTLIENVATRSGKPYDERVREYLNSLHFLLMSEIKDAMCFEKLGTIDISIPT